MFVHPCACRQQPVQNSLSTRPSLPDVSSFKAKKPLWAPSTQHPLLSAPHTFSLPWDSAPHLVIWVRLDKITLKKQRVRATLSVTPSHKNWKMPLALCSALLIPASLLWNRAFSRCLVWFLKYSTNHSFRYGKPAARALV